MKLKVLIIKALLFISPFFVEAKAPELTPNLTLQKSEEILKEHVNFKKISPELVKRIIENFLEELDPTKTYLLDSEVAEWNNPSDLLVSEIVKNYKKARFDQFEKIYDVMLNSISRRGLLEASISDITPSKKTKPSDLQELKWAKDDIELKDRLLKIRSLQLETVKQLEIENQDQFLKHLTKRRLNKELEITQNGEKEEQKKQVLVYFLKSFSSALDNHTVYFTPKEANQFMIQVQQRLFGIGAQLRDDLNGFTLVRLLDGGPALIDGKLKTGDKIIAVNNEPVVGMDINEAVDLIRGPKGSKVTLTIFRETGEGENRKKEKFKTQVVRDEIVLKETRFDAEKIPYGDGIIAHIKLFSFYQDPKDSSSSDIKKAIHQMKNEHNLYGVILDLRGNAGGLLPQAVSVTGLFIQKGIVVSIKDNSGHIQHLRNFDGDVTWDGPLVVLVNKGSASAAEIVAQTLQDYQRAILVGDSHTWGKGSYQTFTLEAGNISKINPQGEYKVTRGLYYTVSGKSPQLTGTKVDIEVPGGLTELDIGENYAKFPIENDEIPPNFHDTLSDIHPFHRGKMMRMYKNNQQKKVDLYGAHIKTLKKNSELRIKQNQNYQNFLTEIHKDVSDTENIEYYGQNDLQLEETIATMKDLILLEKQSSSIKNAVTN